MVSSTSVSFPPVWMVTQVAVEVHPVGDAPVRHHRCLADRLHSCVPGCSGQRRDRDSRRDHDCERADGQARETCVVTFVPFRPPAAALEGRCQARCGLSPRQTLVLIWGLALSPGATVCRSRRRVVSLRVEPASSERTTLLAGSDPGYDPPHERQCLGDRVARDRVEGPDRGAAVHRVVGHQGPAGCRAAGRRRRLARPGPASAPARPPAARRRAAARTAHRSRAHQGAFALPSARAARGPSRLGRCLR